MRGNGETEEERLLKDNRLSAYVFRFVVIPVEYAFVAAFLSSLGLIPWDLPTAIIVALGICYVKEAFKIVLRWYKYGHRLEIYQVLEYKYQEAMKHIRHSEWSAAIKILRQILLEESEHRRALFYAAQCSIHLEDGASAEMYCSRYLDIVEDDDEAWDIMYEARSIQEKNNIPISGQS